MSGYCLTVKSPYQPDEMEDYRGEDAGPYFMSNIRRLGQELRKKIRDANEDMVYGKKEVNESEKATKCHICGGGIRSPKMDYLGKIKKWLKDVGLPNRYPSEKDVKERRYFNNMKISED